VPVHLKPPLFPVDASAAMAASNFLAAPDRRFATSLCYAKITPALLQRGEFCDRSRQHAEAAVCNPEFELSDPRRRIRGDAAPGAKPSCMAAS
jgi:hypothetical protein